MAIGKVHVYELKTPKFAAQVSASSPRFIVSFPTKNHWRGKSRIEDIKSGLQSLVETIERYEIKSMAMPALGCGLGGLDWNDVKPLIGKAFISLPSVEVFLFVPK